ncbi:DUF5710 domain-containing protein [Acrocarpospora catenulata]|uniref:DUF5710 domain-containing protein n=1 Tax=Acrocarpospora catenulata TaxID=2836182 RepID=UPI001BD949C9|nr:DUF5710 domain-containing protein [Acrocarpospora catenulata]
MAERIWLDVPYSQKDEAKALGARWDAQVRRWYAPRPGVVGLDRWAASPPVPDLLPGEDRSWGTGLFVDLVPSSCWFTNVRTCVSGKDWERLRRMITGRAGQRCEACGRAEDRDTRRWLEAHERWAYDDATMTQHLRRLICLCTDCHTATHFGLATIRGKDTEALAHLRTVTGLTPTQAQRHVDEAFQLWQHRSRFTWQLNLSILTNAGVTLGSPPEAEARAQTAHENLRAARSTDG